jgi:hypothetical protein
MRRSGVLLVTLTIILPAHAEIVPKSPEQMQKMATHVVQGKVKAIYASSARAGNYQQTHYLAELAVDKVEKGEGLQEKQLVYVRYWTQAWAGPGQPPPGTAGHRGLPTAGQSVRVYLVNKGYDGGGNVNDGGYNVVFADGFQVLNAAKGNQE